MENLKKAVLLSLAALFLTCCLQAVCSAGETKVSSILSLLQGYDNNVYLDSRRKEDGFTQLYFKTTLTNA